MKQILLILGANGVGKSTASRALLKKLPGSAYVDADWCRAMNPFPFTETTKAVVTENIFCMIRNYLRCPEVERVIFPYSFHGERQAIWERVRMELDGEGIDFTVCPVILHCSREENIRRCRQDERDEERIERGMKNTFVFYEAYTYPKIDTTEHSPDEVAEKIIEEILK